MDVLFELDGAAMLGVIGVAGLGVGGAIGLEACGVFGSETGGVIGSETGDIFDLAVDSAGGSVDYRRLKVALFLIARHGIL